MKNTQFDFLVFIGRFQIFHNGHKAVVDQALESAKKVVILIGSTQQSRNTRNSFTFDERKAMIESVYSIDEVARLVIIDLPDHTYNDQAWISTVQSKVTKTILENAEGNSKHIILHGMRDQKVGLIGHEKDGTSYYLKLFPEWDSVPVEFTNILSATDIRKEYFYMGIGNDENHIDWKVPEPVFNFLKAFQLSKMYDSLVEENEHNLVYKQQWSNSPYPPIFSTVDAVVVQSGYILLVKRGAQPGKGQMALPGGFLDHQEKIVDGIIRELREETKIKVPEPVLRGSIKKMQVFDDPYRSTRGRTITHTALIELEPQTELPKVKGSDDADEAFWFPLGNLKAEELFEDHYHIIHTMIGDS